MTIQKRAIGMAKRADFYPENIALNSLPGAVSQIVTNLVINSLVHGNAREQAGTIRIDVQVDGGKVWFEYSDGAPTWTSKPWRSSSTRFSRRGVGMAAAGWGAYRIRLGDGADGGLVRVDSTPSEAYITGCVFRRAASKSGVGA
ncbi:hypothetical protein RBA41_24600 [Massilia sp. CCM 9210]|uniref:hypothetical protein n=1 Tax=Massilia scottii TaxID=3057166 RepID=UPI002796661A|nr:hypothetical protein [Massilia sp. CCM 9210]MDQ1816482.1 hypothetical protein [Massilia sp. CCM 9210]